MRPRTNPLFRLFRLGIAVLLFCVCALWALSYTCYAAVSYEYVRYQPEARCSEWSYYLYSNGGQLQFCYLNENFHTSIRSTNALKPSGGNWDWVLNQIKADRDGFNFKVWGRDGENSFRNLFAGLPHWALAIPLTAINVVVWLPVLRRRRRLAAGRCPTCGYDI